MREILKAFLKTGVGSAANLLLNIIAVKIIAFILGPNGIGLLSLLRQIMQTAVTAATLSGQTALVQGAASRKDDRRSVYLRTVLIIFLASGILAAGLILILAPPIAQFALGRNDADAVAMVRWLALSVLLAVLAGYVSGALNAYRALGRLALLQVSSALTMAVVAYPVALLVQRNYTIAFVGMITVSQLTYASLGVIFLWRGGWLAQILPGFLRDFRLEAARHFLSFAGTMVITTLVQTGSMLVLRALIVQQEGLTGAGIFDAAWTLSMTYVGLVVTAFGTYYLPTLSATDDSAARATLIQRMFRFCTLAMVPIVVGIIALKPLVVGLLFSSEFTPSLAIMRWMMIGDYLKISSFVFAHLMLAYADMKPFFWSEMAWNVGFVVLVMGIVSRLHWLEGIGLVFLLLYAGYLAFTLIYVRVRHSFRLTRDSVLTWLIGLSLVIGVSVHTWSDTQINWFVAAWWVGVAGFFSWFSLNRRERTQMIQLVLRRTNARVN